jgi:LPXTG-motif cell wall-anchored protein
VSQTSVQPGQTITVSGDGWQANSTITIHWLSTGAVLATTTVNSDGTFSAQVTIPSDATAGTHTIRVSGTNASGNAQSVDIAVTVQAGDPGDDDGDDDRASGGLADTGGTFTPAAALAALLLVVGGGALFASRRLTRSQTT